MSISEFSCEPSLTPPDDLYQCADCDAVFTYKPLVITVEGESRTVCANCIDNYETCERCGERVHVGDKRTRFEQTLCGICYDE